MSARSRASGASSVPSRKARAEQHALAILVLRARRHARAQALVDLEADAARRARGDLHERRGEELLLVGEAHRHVLRAVAQEEHVGELAHRLGHAVRALERPVVHAPIGAPRAAAHHGQLGRRAARELDEAPVRRVALHGDVEARTPRLISRSSSSSAANSLGV
jgi:hypothetical protein